MRYAYYPGCSLHSIGKEYDASLRAVCSKLGIELAEVKGWICCGTSATHAAPRRLAVALPLENLARAERQGLKEMMVPCAACFSRFKFAWHEIEGDAKLRREMEEEVIRHRFSDSPRALHPLQILASEPLLSQITSSANAKLSGLKVVCYYGCLLTRPPKVTGFDDAEYPQSMDRLLRALGASVLDWGYRTDCCGAALNLSRTDIVRRLSRAILEGAKEVGAEAVAVACPLCHLNLDSRQRQIEEEYGTKYNLPIYYFTELLAVALGVPSRELLLERHFVDARTPLESVAAP